MTYPQMITIRRTFTSPVLRDVEAAIVSEVQRLGLLHRIKAGDRIALAVGSRGIANIAQVLKTLGKILISAGG